MSDLKKTGVIFFWLAVTVLVLEAFRQWANGDSIYTSFLG